MSSNVKRTFPVLADKATRYKDWTCYKDVGELIFDEDFMSAGIREPRQCSGPECDLYKDLHNYVECKHVTDTDNWKEFFKTIETENWRSSWSGESEPRFK